MSFRSVAALVLIIVGCKAERPAQQPTVPVPPPKAQTKVVVNEALRTIVYLPLYHAKDTGCFSRAGLNVEIVTGGTATNAFAALLSKEADIAIADPMYVPIAREKGTQVHVIGQLVGRIAVWGVTKDPRVTSLSSETLRGKTIATHPRPMTAYVYTMRAIQDAGLRPDKDVQVLQVKPGSEIVPLLTGQADFALTLEPNVSRATTQGARVVLSYPQLLGDQIFTGIMTRDDYLRDHRAEAVSLVRCVQQSLGIIRANPAAGIPSARKFFPQLDESILNTAIGRIVSENVMPSSVILSEESWNKAIAARVASGDLKRATPLAENADLSIMREAN